MGDTGKTKLQHALQFYDSSGEYPKELDGPDFPDTLKHVWDWFNSLNATREIGFNGPKPISYSEIQAWRNVCGVNLTPVEVQIIKQLDEEYLKFTTDGG